ncbi:MAG: cysteine--tRNA ligase [Candidatus Heimdallarchaeum endolithica]|uniref:Cysteine--tRNA ligase n=1 Tax=Candidatus Heimdallarchaeum endolithica TaxID=2876572 RepID=A0A9Y1BPU2_9ARCH|nr:MAG: cysteine--tRNA ligase [Candidatus Heimdallarchaeum endolithica]
MIKVYNTLTRKLEEFNPINKGKIHWYHCGVTVYSRSHLGHARNLIAFDTIRRYLEYRGYEVRYVQNFTDVDDKMIVRANEEGVSIIELAEKNIQDYYEDLDRLNVKRPSLAPRALLHINHMIKDIQSLIEKGYAYVADNGDVYFDVRKWKEYGKLSKQKLENILEHTEDTENPNKRFPADFALWKAKKEGEPSWPSPWGEGRPGWHIECSTMSMTYLGETFDIHSGGQDLIFPHHENEIAQSESLTGKPFARYWLHNGFVKIDAEKMSKSIGNIININSILKSYSPDSVRLYTLLTHYRQPIDFTEEGLKQAEVTAERLFNTIVLLKSFANDEEESSVITEEDKTMIQSIEDARNKFIEAMDEDFNTSNALAAVFEISKDVNDYLRKVEKINSMVVSKANELFDEFRLVLGLFSDIDQYISIDKVKNLVNLLIDLRQEFRKSKNWEKSDRIRDTLKDSGIILEDNPKRVLWKIVAK